mmetsp:Transcript_15159/g.52675  ORF Transcript_15159/g.52675 Transcript_15159/m.52675 type:complete len:252 (+) Transcript_15159:331-1086(+)
MASPSRPAQSKSTSSTSTAAAASSARASTFTPRMSPCTYPKAWSRRAAVRIAAIPASSRGSSAPHSRSCHLVKPGGAWSISTASPLSPNDSTASSLGAKPARHAASCAARAYGDWPSFRTHRRRPSTTTRNVLRLSCDRYAMRRPPTTLSCGKHAAAQLPVMGSRWWARSARMHARDAARTCDTLSTAEERRSWATKIRSVTCHVVNWSSKQHTDTSKWLPSITTSSVGYVRRPRSSSSSRRSRSAMTRCA